MASKREDLVGLGFAGIDEAMVRHALTVLKTLRVQLFELDEKSAPMDDRTLEKLKQQELTLHSETEVAGALSLVICVIENGGFWAKPKAKVESPQALTMETASVDNDDPTNYAG